MKILNPQPVNGVKSRFGVCSKKARFENRDFAMRFVEWVHMLRLLGAEKIHFSYDYVHPDMFKFIKYFEDRGIVETWQYLDPSGIKSDDKWQLFQLEVNVQTDCFHRVKNLYDYVVIIDMDEVIMPVMVEDLTWENVLNRVKRRENIDAFISQNIYYPENGAEAVEEAPNFMYMLQHIQRLKRFSKKGHGVKSIVSTKRVLTVHTHRPYHCLNYNHHCNRLNLHKRFSQNSHYRNKIHDESMLNETLEDTLIWKYKERLVKDVFETLKLTKFVP
jgi:hypothetical protein